MQKQTEFMRRKKEIDELIFGKNHTKKNQFINPPVGSDADLPEEVKFAQIAYLDNNNNIRFKHVDVKTLV